MYTRFRNISYVMAYAVATIPLWYYVTDDRIMLLMTLVVGFAYVNVVLSSVDAAQGILTSEKTKIPMPRWLPDKPKYQKWWAIKQRTLRWHILLIPAKIGLALGFVEWLHSTSFGSTTTILKPFFYSSERQPAYPQWETLLFGFIVVILFSLLESGLVATLTTITTRPVRVLTLRLLIVLSVIGVMSQYQLFTSFPGPGYPSNFPSWRCVGNDCLQRIRTTVDIGETIETGFLTLGDMGVLLSANIMRPKPHSWYDNRPFVARQLVAALLGVLVYLATIFTVLGFVRDSDFAAER